VGRAESASDTLDAAIPVLTIQAPGEDDQYRGETVEQLRWTATDAHPETQTARVWINGAAADSLASAWTHSGSQVWPWRVPDVLGGSCRLEVTVRDRFGNAQSAVSPDFTIVLQTTGAPPPPAGPAIMDGPRPNPFNPATRILCRLARPGRIRLAVYDLRGRRVRTLADGPRGEGSHIFDWRGDDDEGRRVAAGTYLIRLEHDAGGGRTVRIRKAVMLP
jgi:hypothetical protein